MDISGAGMHLLAFPLPESLSSSVFICVHLWFPFVPLWRVPTTGFAAKSMATGRASNPAGPSVCQRRERWAEVETPGRRPSHARWLRRVLLREAQESISNGAAVCRQRDRATIGFRRESLKNRHCHAGRIRRRRIRIRFSSSLPEPIFWRAANGACTPSSPSSSRTSFDRKSELFEIGQG